MNFIQKFQEKNFSKFYAGRYQARLSLALSLKSKCLSQPEQLSLYQLKIVLNVLNHFKLLPLDKNQIQKQNSFHSSVLMNACYATIFSFTPFFMRQFHNLRLVRRTFIMFSVFSVTYYAMLRNQFIDYISSCQKQAQQYIGLLHQNTGDQEFQRLTGMKRELLVQKEPTN